MSVGNVYRVYEWVICLLLVLFAGAALANGPHLHRDASAAQQRISPADSAAIHQLLKEAEADMMSDQKKALLKTEKALRLAKQLQYTKGMADAYQSKADIAILMENNDSIRILCEQALVLYQDLKDQQGISASLASLGYWAYQRGDYATSLTYNQQALQGYKALNHLEGIAQVRSQLGLLSWSEGNYADALRYFQLSASHYKYAENNLGLIYLELGQDSLALAHFTNNLAVHISSGDDVGRGVVLGNIGVAYSSLKQDSLALHYFQESLSLSQQQESQEGIAFCKKSIGLLLLEQEKTAEALAYIQEANTLYEKMGSKEGVGFCLSGIADVYLKQGNYRLAISSAEKSLALARQLKSKQLISQAAKTLALAYKQDKSFQKALEYHELFQQYSDSLLNAENIRQVEGIRYSYELEKKEIENMGLRHEKELQEAKSQKQLLLILVIGGGLVLAILLIVLLLKNSRTRQQSNEVLARKKEQISIQNEKLQLSNEKLAELDREKDGLMSIVAHDLKSPLNRAHALAQLVRISGPLNAEQISYTQLIEKVARDGGRLIEDLLTLNQAQQISYEPNKSPIVLPDWMDVMLVGYRQQAKAKGIRIQYQPLPTPVELHLDEDALTRILDNLLSNALKFSAAEKSLFISQLETPEGIKLSIRDEGPGIGLEEQHKLFKKFQRLSARPTAGESSTGLGLAIVKTLADKMGAAVSVESELGKGTQFTVLIPRALYLNQQRHALLPV